MKMCKSFSLWVANLFFLTLFTTAQTPPPGKRPAVLDLDTMPNVNGENLKIDRYMQEPHIINPSALCFDKMGRLYVGAGPQYRAPKPDSPKDYIKILIDKDHDGKVDEVKKFAEGFNSIQGMVWRDNELWVANAPELTVLVDTDGDDVADIYRVVYRGLNTLRHGLHGLNWAPDGKLYMSYGNTRSGDHAPQVIRDLQRIKSDLPDLNPYNKDYTVDTYEKGYRTMKKQETEGAILRCDRKGLNLELFSRGLRNPWDITFDTEFNWLGTDNDPGPQHDRIFMPIELGHYTMRHPYKFDWNGKHEAIAPVAALFPTVSGSGTGVIYVQNDYFGAKHKGRYFIADWTNKSIFSYKVKWDGAHQTLDGELEKIVDGGLTNGGDLGFKGGKGVSLFRPTDIEIGPAGDLYIAGWGSVYGTEYIRGTDWDDKENSKYQGRIFRLHNTTKPISVKSWNLEKRQKPITDWSFAEVMEDMGSHIPVWRTNAQDEMVRRGLQVKDQLMKELKSAKLSTAATTWTTWALAHIEKENKGDFVNIIFYAKGENGANQNMQIQALRALGLFKVSAAQDVFVKALKNKEARVRHVALLGLQKVGFGSHTDAILASLENETDRVCNYTAFQVMRRVFSIDERKQFFDEKAGNIKKIFELSLLEDKAMKSNSKGAAGPIISLNLSEVNWRESTKASFIKENFSKNMKLHYTLDGSKPTPKSPVYKKPFTIDKSTKVQARIFEKNKAKSKVLSFTVNKISESEWKNRLFAFEVNSKSKKNYSVKNEALQNGVQVYSDRSYTFSDVPTALSGSTMIQTANDDKGSKEKDFISFSTNIESEVYIAWDSRNKPADWLSSKFNKTDLKVKLSDGTSFHLHKAKFPAGKVVLGGNSSGSKSSMYQVFLKKVSQGDVTQNKIKGLIAKADIKLGEEIFFGRGTCFACHKVGNRGVELGPDLQGINKRRDVDYVIKSIVDPNAYIVEGYQQTVLTMKDGSQLFGMVQEETGEQIVLFLPTGEKKVAKVKDIKKKEDNPNSGMPSSFIHTLSSKDIADLSAWIMTLKPVKKK